MSFIVFIAFSYTDKGISLGAKADSSGEEYFLTLAPRLKFFIEAVESSYSVILPSIKHWFLQRVDIALCFDLGNNNTVKKYNYRCQYCIICNYHFRI